MGFGLGEGFVGSVVGGDEVVDAPEQLCRNGEAGAFEGLAAEDGKSDFDLVHPGGIGWCEVETHIGMAGEPAVALGLVGGQVVEHDTELALGIGGDRLVHEVVRRRHK
jgi:hypothetical protein